MVEGVLERNENRSVNIYSKGIPYRSSKGVRLDGGHRDLSPLGLNTRKGALFTLFARGLTFPTRQRSSPSGGLVKGF